MKVKLTNARLSFPTLFEAEQYDGQGPYRYRASFLVEPKSENHKALLNAMKEVAKAEWKDKYEKILEAADDDSKLRFLVDGNKKDYDGYEGMLVVNATRDQTKGKPLILDRDKSVLTATDGKPYGGCYVNATLEIWAQNNKFGKTVRAQLLAVQFSKDGDAFGAGMTKGDPEEFENLSDSGDDDDLVA